jgi:uncharacterized protein YutE (UPF0331/DUF86 family)
MRSRIDDLAAGVRAAFSRPRGLSQPLVHGYLEVDRGQLHRLLNERPEDFVEFGQLIAAWLPRA